MWSKIVQRNWIENTHTTNVCCHSYVCSFVYLFCLFGRLVLATWWIDVSSNTVAEQLTSTQHIYCWFCSRNSSIFFCSFRHCHRRRRSRRRCRRQRHRRRHCFCCCTCSNVQIIFSATRRSFHNITLSFSCVIPTWALFLVFKSMFCFRINSSFWMLFIVSKRRHSRGMLSRFSFI